VKVADERGVVERGRLCQEVRGEVSDSARDKAIGALIEKGELRRIKNGLYEVPDLAARYAVTARAGS
jgi:predicted transcriptional regulator of viral defense system